MKKYYKIVELKNNELMTLFHGINRNRKLPMNKWLKAQIKNVTDGGTYYQSGWHIIPNLKSCQQYLQKFKKKRKLIIVECEAKNIWKKEHSPNNVYLSEYIRINKITK
jgi:hypothetical protein